MQKKNDELESINKKMKQEKDKLDFIITKTYNEFEKEKKEKQQIKNERDVLGT